MSHSENTICPCLQCEIDSLRREVDRLKAAVQSLIQDAHEKSDTLYGMQLGDEKPRHVEWIGLSLAREFEVPRPSWHLLRHEEQISPSPNPLVRSESTPAMELHPVG